MRAAWAGSLVALILDVIMLSDGQFSLWRQMGLLGSFFDAQGRALLHGHLAVPPSSVSFEGFLVGGHTYMYFGPVPALLRLPVLLFTHALDGRMTQLSMLLALIVLLDAGARVHWRVREMLRPRAPVGNRERLVVMLLALALGAGGVPLFLVSWPVVYHESELWGAALAIAALNAVLAVAEWPSGKRIAWAGALCVLAINSRVSVGLGPVIALALFAAAVAARALAAARGAGRASLFDRSLRVIAHLGPRETDAGARTFAWLTLAVVVTLGSELLINELKFHTPFGLPMYDHVNFHIDPIEHAAVIANHGSVIGLQYLPTSLLAAVRPDAIGLMRAFPFIGLPQSSPTVIGSALFVGLLPSLSAVTSMPLFCVLLIVGLPAVVRSPRSGPLLAGLLGTALAFVPTLLVSSVATRYLGDLLPFLWLGACAGVQALAGVRRVSERVRLRRFAVPALVAIALLAFVGIAANGAVGIVQQRLLASTATPAQRASFIRAQDDIDRFLGRRPHGIHIGSAVPHTALGPLGDLFILGRCDGLYVESFGGAWLPVERTARSGLHDLSVTFPPRGHGSRPVALLTLGRGADRVTVVLRGNEVYVRVGGRTVSAGAVAPVRPGRTARFRVSIDPLNGRWFLSVGVDGHAVASLVPVPYDRLAHAYLGVDPSDPRLRRFPGLVAAAAEPTPVCNLLAGRAGLSGAQR
jgi:hypothetical protein